MHKRKIIDLWYFTVCCKRRKRGSRAGSSEAPVLRLCSRGCSPHARYWAGAGRDNDKHRRWPQDAAQRCSRQGSAAITARQALNPEGDPGTSAAPGRCALLHARHPPLSRPAADPRSHLRPPLQHLLPAPPPPTILIPPPARSTSRPLFSLSARLPSLPRRGPNHTTPNKPKQQKMCCRG